MRCLNCGRDIPDSARVCQFCEAAVEPAPTEEELNAARELAAHLPPEALAELHQAFLNSPTREDFINAIMVGPCPKCGSTKTADCEDDPEIGINLIARCYDCGQFWCAECGKLLEGPSICDCWDEEDQLSEDDDDRQP